MRSLTRSQGRSALLFALMLLALCVLAAPLPARAQQPDSAAAVAVDEADHVALRALKDLYERSVRDNNVNALAPHLDPGFTGVMVTGESIASFDELKHYWQSIQDLIGEGGRYETTVTPATKSLILGDLAIAYGDTADKVVTGAGKTYEFTTAWTAICRKVDGDWKILRVQGSMDPVRNVFVMAGLKRTMIWSGGFAGIAGILVGWLAHVAWSRRHRAASTGHDSHH